MNSDQNQLQTEPIQVDTTKTVKGQIKVGPRNWKRPTPTILARCTKAIRYLCSGLILSVNTAPMLNSAQASSASWWLSVIILFTGGIELMVGIKVPEKK